MALYGPAIKKLIPPGKTDPKIKVRVVILHVAVSEQPSLYAYFNGPSQGVESHFYIRRDGTVEQYRDTGWQADANTDANGFAISIETQGMERGEWTPQQMDAIKALILWCHEVHGIPLVRCPAWDGAGIGYHTLFPGRWDKRGASCPGPDRKLQFNQIISPWLADSSTPKDWFDMATTADLRAAVKAELNDPDFLRNVARFVLTGMPTGPEGDELVLAGHLTKLQALAAAALTPAQLTEALKDAVQIDVTVSAKESS